MSPEVHSEYTVSDNSQDGQSQEASSTPRVGVCRDSRITVITYLK